MEWDAVHLIAASDGTFPSDKALSSPEGLEEERRLLFVGLTRARRTLALHVPARYYHRPATRDDAHGYGKPSRFITAPAEALCERTTARAGPQEASGPLTALGVDVKVRVDLSRLWR